MGPLLVSTPPFILVENLKDGLLLHSLHMSLYSSHCQLSNTCLEHDLHYRRQLVASSPNWFSSILVDAIVWKFRHKIGERPYWNGPVSLMHFNLTVSPPTQSFSLLLLFLFLFSSPLLTLPVSLILSLSFYFSFSLLFLTFFHRHSLSHSLFFLKISFKSLYLLIPSLSLIYFCIFVLIYSFLSSLSDLKYADCIPLREVRLSYKKKKKKRVSLVWY